MELKSFHTVFCPASSAGHLSNERETPKFATHQTDKVQKIAESSVPRNLGNDESLQLSILPSSPSDLGGKNTLKRSDPRKKDSGKDGRPVLDVGTNAAAARLAEMKSGSQKPLKVAPSSGGRVPLKRIGPLTIAVSSDNQNNLNKSQVYNLQDAKG